MKQVVKWAAEGAVKCACCAQSILRRDRQTLLPGVCLYPAKRTAGREFKVAPRIIELLFVLDRNRGFCQGRFFTSLRDGD